MKSLAILAAKNIIFIVIGMVLAYAKLSPFEHGQWWAWFLLIMFCVLLRDLAIHLEGNK